MDDLLRSEKPKLSEQSYFDRWNSVIEAKESAIEKLRNDSYPAPRQPVGTAPKNDGISHGGPDCLANKNESVCHGAGFSGSSGSSPEAPISNDSQQTPATSDRFRSAVGEGERATTDSSSQTPNATLPGLQGHLPGNGSAREPRSESNAPPAIGSGREVSNEAVTVAAHTPLNEQLKEQIKEQIKEQKAVTPVFSDKPVLASPSERLSVIQPSSLPSVRQPVDVDRPAISATSPVIGQPEVLSPLKNGAEADRVPSSGAPGLDRPVAPSIGPGIGINGFSPRISANDMMPQIGGSGSLPSRLAQIPPVDSAPGVGSDSGPGGMFPPIPSKLFQPGGGDRVNAPNGGQGQRVQIGTAFLPQIQLPSKAESKDTTPVRPGTSKPSDIGGSHAPIGIQRQLPLSILKVPARATDTEKGGQGHPLPEAAKVSAKPTEGSSNSPKVGDVQRVHANTSLPSGDRVPPVQIPANRPAGQTPAEGTGLRQAPNSDRPVNTVATRQQPNDNLQSIKRAEIAPSTLTSIAPRFDAGPQAPLNEGRAVPANHVATRTESGNSTDRKTNSLAVPGQRSDSFASATAAGKANDIIGAVPQRLVAKAEIGPTNAHRGNRVSANGERTHGLADTAGLAQSFKTSTLILTGRGITAGDIHQDVPTNVTVGRLASMHPALVAANSTQRADSLSVKASDPQKSSTRVAADVATKSVSLEQTAGARSPRDDEALVRRSQNSNTEVFNGPPRKLDGGKLTPLGTVKNIVDGRVNISGKEVSDPRNNFDGRGRNQADAKISDGRKAVDGAAFVRIGSTAKGDAAKHRSDAPNLNRSLDAHQEVPNGNDGKKGLNEIIINMIRSAAPNARATANGARPQGDDSKDSGARGDVNFDASASVGQKKDYEVFRSKLTDDEKFLHKVDAYNGSLKRSHTVSATRVRYIVRQGDTLESIAITRLGDARFSNLLVTINRSEIHFVDFDDVTVPVVYAGQTIWLPALKEVEIYKKHFFSSKAQASGSFPALTPSGNKVVSGQNINAVETPLFDRTVISKPQIGGGVNRVAGQVDQQEPRLAVDACPVSEDERFAQEGEIVVECDAQMAVENCAEWLIVDACAMGEQAESDKAGDTAVSQIACSLESIRFAGRREAICLADSTNRRTYTVRLGETLQSIALRDSLMRDARLWKLLASLNAMSLDVDATNHPITRLTRGQIIWLPNELEVEEYRLLNKGSSIPCSPESKGCEMSESESGRPSVECAKISDNCRLISLLGTVCSIVMQIELEGIWSTIARYDCREYGTSRTLFHVSGSAVTFKVDLPKYVAVQMAIEDFRRNCELYRDAHFADKHTDFVPVQLINHAVRI